MSTSYPGAKDSFTTKIDDPGGTTVYAAHVNDLQDSVVAIETKLGADGSAVATTLDYLLKNTSSVDPGHKHSDTSLNSLAHSKLTFTGLTAKHALIASGASAASFRAIAEGDISPGSILARVADTETITGSWTLSNVYSFLLKDGIGDTLIRMEDDNIAMGSGMLLYWYAGLAVGSGVPDIGLRRSNTATLRVTYADDAPGPGDLGHLEVDNLKLFTADGLNFSTLRFTGTGEHTYTLPATGPINGYYLQTDGTGLLSWVVGGGGGGSTTYVGLTDTPGTFTASAIPYTNGAATALLHSANLVWTGTRFKALNSTKTRLGTADTDDGWLNVTFNDSDEALILNNTTANPVIIRQTHTGRSWDLIADDSPDEYRIYNVTKTSTPVLIAGATDNITLTSDAQILLDVGTANVRLSETGGTGGQLQGLSTQYKSDSNGQYTGHWFKCHTNTTVTDYYKGAIIFERSDTDGRGELHRRLLLTKI